MAARSTKGRGRGPDKRPRKGTPRPGNGGARPGTGPKRRIRRIADYKALGNAPADELDRIRWMSAALGVRARQVMLDDVMSDSERGAELRSLARAMNSLVTRNRLRQAEKAVRERHETVKAPTADPAVEAVPVTDEETPP